MVTHHPPPVGSRVHTSADFNLLVERRYWLNRLPAAPNYPRLSKYRKHFLLVPLHRVERRSRYPEYLVLPLYERGTILSIVKTTPFPYGWQLLNLAPREWIEHPYRKINNFLPYQLGYRGTSVQEKSPIQSLSVRWGSILTLFGLYLNFR